jgi:hypothetical protein
MRRVGGAGKAVQSRRHGTRQDGKARNQVEGSALASQEHFAQILKRVCRDQAWDLLPSGVQVSWPNGRRQLVELKFFQFQREELVRLFTTIGDVNSMGAVRLMVALRINAELAHGCLAVHDDDLVMTDTLMLRDADSAEIEASIGYLAETADHYEQTIFGTDQY